jgi:GTP cyclohydrolase I
MERTKRKNIPFNGEKKEISSCQEENDKERNKIMFLTITESDANRLVISQEISFSKSFSSLCEHEVLWFISLKDTWKK